MNSSVKSQLIFVAVIDRHREDYTDGNYSGEIYLVIQAAMDIGIVQYKPCNIPFPVW